MSYKFATVILAAGEGKRLKHSSPKPLAPLLGKRLVDYPIKASELFFTSEKKEGKVYVVVGHRKEEVLIHLKNTYGDKIESVIQENQRGTADALRSYFGAVKDASSFEYTIVLCADTPLIRAEEIQSLYRKMLERESDAIVATFHAPVPKGYGRVLKNGEEKGLRIVEEKDASEEERKCTEVNSGFYLFKTSFLEKFLNQISANNKAAEFYLTDIFAMDRNVVSLSFDSERRFAGVNDLRQLEQVSHYLIQDKVEELREQGVYFHDSKRVILSPDCSASAGCVIYPDVVIEGKSQLGKNVVVESGTVIKNATIGDDCEIYANSYLESCTIKNRVHVGPFARIRPDSILHDECKVGNFVETKKAELAVGVKVSHLSYVGDAYIGENTNIGCGFITCNYDGAKKHFTKIGKDCFIGSDTQVVAPLEIGDSSFVASGSTITNSMPSGSFAISRGRQVTKEMMASRFIKKK